MVSYSGAKKHFFNQKLNQIGGFLRQSQKSSGFVLKCINLYVLMVSNAMK